MLSEIFPDVLLIIIGSPLESLKFECIWMVGGVNQLGKL